MRGEKRGEEAKEQRRLEWNQTRQQQARKQTDTDIGKASKHKTQTRRRGNGEGNTGREKRDEEGREGRGGAGPSWTAAGGDSGGRSRPADGNGALDVEHEARRVQRVGVRLAVGGDGGGVRPRVGDGEGFG